MIPSATLSPSRRISRLTCQDVARNWERQLEEHSQQRIQQIRSQIASGSYSIEDKIDLALDRLMADL
jgi:anti-sigma28 factor (negative regulator of flagellin synthesis)